MAPKIRPVPTQEPPILVSEPRHAAAGYPIDPGRMLEAQGCFWNDNGDLIHLVPKREGIRIIDGKAYYVVVDHERKVAPPGTSMEHAASNNLDVFSPRLGWIWGGVKRATEHPDNLGHGAGSRSHRLVPVPDDTLEADDADVADEASVAPEPTVET